MRASIKHTGENETEITLTYTKKITQVEYSAIRDALLRNIREDEREAREAKLNRELAEIEAAREKDYPILKGKK